jgi:hypothetical protein
MKKIVLFLVLIGVLTVNAFAVDSTGCGLGSTLLKGKNGTLFQLVAVTTNTSVSGNQLFGISSGTLGCDQNGRISGGTGKIFVFLENNVDSFVFDVAKGEGETINVIAEIAGIDSKEVAGILKQNYNVLFDDENIDIVALSVKISNLLNIA